MLHSVGRENIRLFWHSVYGELQKTSDEIRKFNPIFSYFIPLIHFSKTNEGSPMHQNVTLMDLRWTLPTTDEISIFDGREFI